MIGNSRRLNPPRLIRMKPSPLSLDGLLYPNGQDEIGGKAQGLLAVWHVLEELNRDEFSGIEVDIPPMSVIGSSIFDAFIERNHLRDIVFSDLPDDRIAHAFQHGDLPFEVLGQLRNLILQVQTPLAVRSSGLLEDTTRRPFAGVYLTKMIPNNQPDPDIRFRKLVEAIKSVWASTYYKTARDYCRAAGLRPEDEKMAVIIQEIVGKRHDHRFYPELSGVARSYNYYPLKQMKPEDGVVSLALGLGKTIVDGGRSWTYSPAYPKIPPPYSSVEELLNETQTTFWVLNMGEPPEYNPMKETEYMHLENLMTAEKDGVLRYLASTYHPQSERLSAGIGGQGPRVITFAPLLALDEIPVNRLIQVLLDRCEEALDCAVEIEFAMTFDPPRFGFLQVRPMAVPTCDFHLALEDLTGPEVFLASESVLGNGCLENLSDVVYIRPEKFDLRFTRLIASELERLNNRLLAEQRPYLLIVFGRLGTFDPWLGIPVTWGQVCGARAIVEATQENVKVELSQGSHYFHNIISLGVLYFSVPFSSPYRIDWDWLGKQPVIEETDFVRHVRLPAPLIVKVDGKNGRGVILKM